MKKTYILIILIIISINSFGQITGNSPEIGVLEGELSVSLTGAAVYQVPINVPPGINGVTPQIGLAYNSQSGNGVAGFGWNLTGVSAITRIPTTKYHNGFIDGVDLDSNDKFALDGQRLILKSGVYGQDGAVYETENYSNTKIVSNGTSGSGGPESFTVYYPDGTRATYGYNAKTKNTWGIVLYKNNRDVRILYTYFIDGGSLFLNSIKYGKKGTNDGFNIINFQYNTRVRSEHAFISGHSISNRKILKSIHVKSNYNVGYRNYYLNHNTTSLGYERLISITEKNGDNSKELNPTIFTYEDTSNSDLFEHTESNSFFTNISALNSSYISGDFDGDTKMDYILYPKSGAQKKRKYWLVNDISSGNQFPIEDNLGYRFEDIFTVNLLSHNNKIFSRQGWTVVKKENNNLKFKVFIKGITNPISFQYEKTVSFPTVEIEDIDCYNDNGYIEKSFPKKILNGDFNGDGLSDVIAIDKRLSYLTYDEGPWGDDCIQITEYINSKKVYFVDLKRDVTTNYWSFIGELNNFLPNSSDNYNIQVADFNGDGKSDFIVFQNNKVTVYTLNNDNNQLIQLTSISNDGDIDMDKPLLVGDYNGDGKSDFVIPEQEYQDNWNFYLSDGNNFRKISGSINLTFGNNFSGNIAIDGTIYYDVLVERSYIPNDINSDGKTDIIYVANYTYNNSGNNIVTFTNLSENIETTFSQINFNFDANNSTNLYGNSIKKFPLPIFLNHNNVNQNLELALLSANKIHHFKHTKDHRQDVLLREVTTGNGVQKNITYKPLIEEENPQEIISPYIATSYNETYPNFDIINAISLNVVSKLEKQTDNQNSKQLYSYYGAVTNVEGLGFLGFKSVLQTNFFNDDYGAVSNVTKQDISKRGAVFESYSTYGIQLNYNNSPSNFINKTINNLSASLSDTKVFTVINNSSINYNGLYDTSIEFNYTYDIYNNPLTISEITKENGTVQKTKTTTVEYTHNPTGSTFGNLYYIGRVKNKNAISSVGSNTFSFEEEYTYNSSQLILQHKEKGDNTDFLYYNFSYDSFGNVIAKTISGQGISNRTTHFEYESTGRFLIKTIGVEGLETMKNYNFNGYLLSEINPLGLSTNYEYDSWGKKIKETDYLGNETSIIYSRPGSGTSGRTQIHVNYPDGKRGFKYFDNSGRIIVSASSNFENTWKYIQTSYDIYDRKIQVSEPYQGWGNASQYTFYDYDNYGRQIRVIDYRGKTTDFVYNGLTTTSTDGTKTVTITKNALDQIVSLTDEGGTILYNYYANNKLKQSNFDGSITSMEYDGWGRKIKLIDSSAGEYTYQYNILGEMIKETTPRGQTIYSLDEFGNLTQKKITGNYTNLVSDYHYDTSTKLLNSITTNQNTTYNYLYDNYKRLQKTTETSSQAIFEKILSFDGLGRVSHEQYKATNISSNTSSNYKIRKTYKNGILWKIHNNWGSQELLWQANSFNVRGQLTETKFGNNIIESLSYDSYGFPTRNHSKLNSNSLIDLNYSFEQQRGLLLNRSNSLFNFNETFQYDDLDRLTHFTNKFGQTEIQNYDDKGRITSNKIGNYNYNSSKPYQNSSINLSVFGKNYYENRPLQQVNYNSFKAPYNIVEQDIEKIVFRYNIFKQRSMMYYNVHSNSGISSTTRENYETIKYYSWDGSMEIKKNTQTGDVEFLTYLGDDAYSTPIVFKKTVSGGNLLYLHRDYLGSIVGISNHQGIIKEKRAYNAWGEIAFLEDNNGNTLNELTLIDRGYTGHEHLEKVKLIHMNARLYDAKTHRFLAPDNYVQDPYNTQNYNRYSYVLNNPLSFVDKNGECWLVLVGAIVGAYTGASIQQGSFNPAKWDSDWWKGAVVGGVLGAFAGQSLALIVKDTSFLASGSISGHTVFAKTMMSAGKSMFKSYLSSIFGFDFKKGFTLHLSLDLDKTLQAGAIGALKGLAGQGIDKIYKDKKGMKPEDAKKMKILIKNEKYGKLTRNLLKNTLGGISKNLVMGNKGVFEDLTFLSFGNGFIKIGEGSKVFNISRLSKQAEGWALYALASDLGVGITPTFDLYSLGFDYNNEKALGDFALDILWNNASANERFGNILFFTGTAGVLSAFGLKIE
jgi:RHS repeat-associated protein